MGNIEQTQSGYQQKPSEFDDQFNLRKRHRLARFHLLKNTVQSKIARRLLRCKLDISYGNSEGQKLDIFPAICEGAPVLFFIHGGYFRALDKSQYSYIARHMVKSGYTVVLVNYDLAPRVPVSEIVQQVLASFTWVREHIFDWNGDPSQVVLCGHSVGSFLAVKILEQKWPNGSGIRKAALLSGLYDLGPMKQSFLNRDLKLTDAIVRQLNPRTTTILEHPDILVAVGKKETEEFIFQSRNFHQELLDAGANSERMILPGINHYTMSRLLAQKENPVMDWIASRDFRP